MNLIGYLKLTLHFTNMIVRREEVDSALADWLSLGFSQESLDILKHRLYGRVSFESSRSHFALMSYEGFDPSRQSHVIKFDNDIYMSKRDKIDSSKYHEIRHCASAEIFHTILDKGSELYKGLDPNDADKKILSAYESFNPLPITRKRTFLMAPIFSKEKRRKINERIELVERVESYDGNKLEIISENKTSLADALFYLFGVRNANLRESIAGTELEVVKNNKEKKVSALIVLSSLSALPVLICLAPNSPALFAMSVLAYWVSGYFYTVKNCYGDVGARRRLKNNIQNVQGPYDQFLRFITTE
jgi:hypothetical protein